MVQPDLRPSTCTWTVKPLKSTARCHTCGYFPSRRTSLPWDWYQLACWLAIFCISKMYRWMQCKVNDTVAMLLYRCSSRRTLLRWFLRAQSLRSLPISGPQRQECSSLQGRDECASHSQCIASRQQSATRQSKIADFVLTLHTDELDQILQFGSCLTSNWYHHLRVNHVKW